VTCGNSTFIFKNSNFTYFPASSWGGDAKALLTGKVYLHAGAYEVNPHDKTSATHGFDFGTDDATGTTIPFELGYETSFANDSLPRHYQIGGWYDDSDYSDPLLDSSGNNAVLSGKSYATDHGRSGAFFRFDQMVWRPDSNSKRGLTLFGIVMTRVSGRVTEDRFYELGLLQTGTFAGRDEDTVGFMVNDQQFSDSVLAGITAARQSAGGNGSIPKHEVMMELAYGAQITPSIRLSPNLQYIVNPDQMAEPFRTRNIPDAFVVGFKFTVDLSKIAGLAPPEY
jgi:porin